MSRINDLIKELCPNGVVFKRIGEIANYRRGSFPQPYTNESYYGGEDAMPFVQVADVKDNFRLVDSTKNTISKIAQPLSVFVPKGTVIVTLQGTIGRVAITQYDAYVDRTLAIFEGLSSELNTKYFVYQLKSKFDYEKQFARGSTIKTITKEEMTEFKIPIPPIEVQNEIVRILDKFGELEADLEAELEAELEARKSQYEFWRAKVFDSDDIMVNLGDVCDVTAGGTPSKSNDEYWNNGTIKWLGSTVCENKKGISEITNYITELGLNKSSAKILKPGTTLIAMVGATIGKVAYLDFEACTNQNVASLYPKNSEMLDSSYLYHACRNLYSTFLDYANGKFAMASLGYIKNLEIPLPNINEQKKIANLLDRFDSLINDISIGIPAEIELRRQQYEYYRNKLLSFEEL